MTSLVPGLVSTVIPVRNRPALLREAVQSVLAQSYRPIEIVIVDDGSTDETWAVACALRDQHPEVRAERIAPSGIGSARNAGLKQVSGEFVQYLDSDDLLLCDKFAVQVAALASAPDAGIAYCRVREYPLPGEWNGEPARNTGETFETLFPALVRDRIWCTPSPLYRRSVVEAIGDFEPVSIHEDWEYEARAAARGVKLLHQDVYLAEKRNVHAAEGRNKGGARPEQLADYAAMQLLILKHARSANVEPAALKPAAARLFNVAEQCALGGALVEAQRCFDAALDVDSDPPARVLRLGAAARTIGWQRAAVLGAAVTRTTGRVSRLVAWPGRVIRYLHRRRRELPLERRADRILRDYTRHYHQAQGQYQSTSKAPSPGTPVEGVGVRVINRHEVPGVALPGNFQSMVARVAASADRAFREQPCTYFPPSDRTSGDSPADALEAVRRGEVISIKLVDPFELEGLAELMAPLLGQIEREVYGSHVLVDKVYVYRSPITTQQPAKSWLWHYDNHPREMLKLMVYLTDVDEGSAPFEYIRECATGLPKPGHPLAPMMYDSRVPIATIDAWLANGHERVALTGAAGTVILFDDNVVHRATLARTGPRDVVVFQLRPVGFKPEPPIDRRWTGSFSNRDFTVDPWRITPEPF